MLFWSVLVVLVWFLPCILGLFNAVADFHGVFSEFANFLRNLCILLPGTSWAATN
jgi:hypothetical protein